MARLNAGDKFPDFKVNTQYEDGTSISKIADGKPLMVVVLRYIGCTSCRFDVQMIHENHDEFVKKGVNVVVVMQSKVESLRRDLKDEPLSFPIISDPDYEIYNALDIRPAKDMEELRGNAEDQAKRLAKKEKIAAYGFKHGEYEGIEEQLPAFFYLNADLTVKEAHYARSIADMPTVEEMLAK